MSIKIIVILIATNVPEPGRYSLESLGITKDGYCPKGGYKSTVS